MKKHILKDASLWLLLFSNLVTIFFAIKDGWDLSTIIWVYLFQAVTIGFFNFIRIFQLRSLFNAFFFLIHYGSFNLAYATFLSNGTFGESLGTWSVNVDPVSILISAFVFFINHMFSFIYNKDTDSKYQNIVSLMFYPYIRIIPIHITIIMAVYLGPGALPFFLILKTFSDLLLHTLEHKVVRREHDFLRENH